MKALCSTLLAACLMAALLAAPGAAQAQDANPRVKLTTSKGVIVLELDPAKAPVTVENFLKYVKEGFYDGLIFHRVINGFMIQGGGMDKSMRQKPTYPPIKNEADNGLKNDAYTVAMARTMDPHSATAQFYINVVDNPNLNQTNKTTTSGYGYAVFGKVVEGKDVVDAIKAVPTGMRGGQGNVPMEPVEIVKAEVVK